MILIKKEKNFPRIEELGFHSGEAADQLTASEQRLTRVAATGAIAQWYQAHTPALILGRTQKPEHINLEACTKYGIKVIGRASGGTAILVGADFLSLDIALPIGHPLYLTDITEAYRWLGETWASTLQSFGIAADVLSIEQSRHQTQSDRTNPHYPLLQAVCFGTVSPYEVVVNGRKLVGLSQLRRKPGALLQAGIHLNFDRELMAELILVQPDQRSTLVELLHTRAVALNEVSSNAISVPTLIEAFRSHYAKRYL